MSAVPEPSTNWSNTGRRTARAFSKDLESRLDWIAVDHRNTGHAHTHMIVRGVLDDGRILILNIAGDYIAHGIRHRASELVTLELDHQGEIELQTKAEERGRSRAMDPARQDVADRAAGAGDSGEGATYLVRENRGLMIGRVKHLERYGLANEVEQRRWGVSDRAEGSLTELSERNDVIKTVISASSR